MPVQFEDVDVDPVCFGASWTEKSRNVLIEHIADLLDGHFIKVARLIKQGATSKEITKYGKVALKKVLTESTVEHRDGWLFQMISYICLLKKNASDKSVYIAHPHIQPADKGFDNLLMKISPKNQIEYISVTEDKATVSPRAIFLRDILPEFKSIDNGERTGQLRTCVSVLLQKSELDDEEIEDEIERFFWKPSEEKDDNILRFRANLIVEKGLAYDALFKRYNKVIAGDKIRRQGEIFKVENMRKWMQKLTDDILAHIEK